MKLDGDGTLDSRFVIHNNVILTLSCFRLTYGGLVCCVTSSLLAILHLKQKPHKKLTREYPRYVGLHINLDTLLHWYIMIYVCNARTLYIG